MKSFKKINEILKEINEILKEINEIPKEISEILREIHEIPKEINEIPFRITEKCPRSSRHWKSKKSYGFGKVFRWLVDGSVERDRSRTRNQ